MAYALGPFRASFRPSGCTRSFSFSLFHSNPLLKCAAPDFQRIPIPASNTKITTVPVVNPVPPSPLSLPLTLEPLPDVATPPPENEGWLKSKLRKYLKGNSLHSGEVLALKAVKHSENPIFTEKCGVPTDPFSQLALKAVHIWVVQQRVMEDLKPESQDVIHRIYDVLWNTLENDMNKKGYMWTNRQMKQAQGAVFGGLYTYDRTLQVAAASGDFGPYLGALWRNLYAANRSLNRAHLVQMREYIVDVRMKLRAISDSDFYMGEVEFGFPGPLVPSPEADKLDPDEALKPFFKPGDEELKYVYTRSPFRTIKFEEF